MKIMLTFKINFGNINNMKIIKYIFVTIFGVIFISCSSNLLRKSEEKIRDDILILTPIGSNMDEVIEVIKNNKEWQIQRDGIFKRWSSLSDYQIQRQMDHYVSVKSISVLLGRWFLRYVDATWKLDENGMVIDIHVRKSMAK
jgi:hypothetical protein